MKAGAMPHPLETFARHAKPAGVCALRHTAACGKAAADGSTEPATRGSLPRGAGDRFDMLRVCLIVGVSIKVTAEQLPGS